MVFYDSPQKVFALIIASFALGASLSLIFDLTRFARSLVFDPASVQKQSRNKGKKALGAIGLFISDLTQFVFFALINVVFFSYRCSGRIRADCLISEALAVFLYYIIIGKRTKKLEERSAAAIRKKTKELFLKLCLPLLAFAKNKYDNISKKMIAKRRIKESRACEKALIAGALGGFGAEIFKKTETETEIEN